MATFSFLVYLWKLVYTVVFHLLSLLNISMCGLNMFLWPLWNVGYTQVCFLSVWTRHGMYASSMNRGVVSVSGLCQPRSLAVVLGWWASGSSESSFPDCSLIKMSLSCWLFDHLVIWDSLYKKHKTNAYTSPLCAFYQSQFACITICLSV